MANHLFVLDPVLSPQENAQVCNRAPHKRRCNTPASAHLTCQVPPPFPHPQLIGRIARQGQRKPCVVYHLAVYNSIEERLLRLRDKIARGDAATEAAVAGGAARNKAAAAAALAARLKDANASLTDRLSTADLLALLDNGATQDEEEGAGAGAQ
jgi:hypothetical protein